MGAAREALARLRSAGGRLAAGRSVQPYAGVKTSVLVFRRPRTELEDGDGATRQIWFYGIRNDGYDPDRIQQGGRPETPEKNDISGLLAAWADYEASDFLTPPGVEAGSVLDPGSGDPRCWWASFERIEESDFNLAASRYKPLVAEETLRDDPADLIREVLAIEKKIAVGLKATGAGQRTEGVRSPRTAAAQRRPAVPVTPELLHRMVRAIVDEVDPEQIILFGSRGRGDARVNSDVDLLVIEAESFGAGRGKHEEMNRLYRALRGFHVPKDILVFSNEEVEYWRDSLNHVLARAFREGKVLYERL